MTNETTIPFVDLHAQYLNLKDSIDGAIHRVVQAKSFILGKEVAAFEKAFAEFCEVPYCIGVSSGTDSLEQALAALGIGPGDEVITVAHTFIATAEAICAVGATPRFVDVRPDTLLMDPALVEAAITSRTRAIVPVHLYGQMVDMEALMEVARRHSLLVVEDCAQAHGATFGGRLAGSVGAAGSFSFYPGKNLGAYGDAGAVTCQEEKLAKRVQQGRNHGRLGKYEHEFVGRNARMDGMQGAILAAKLPHLAPWNESRRQVAAKYDSALAALGQVKRVHVDPKAMPVYHLYVVRVPNRDAVLASLHQQGIEAGVHYPIPLHLQPAFAALGYREGQFPHTETAAKEILSLPIWPEIDDASIQRVVQALQGALSSCGSS